MTRPESPTDRAVRGVLSGAYDLPGLHDAITSAAIALRTGGPVSAVTDALDRLCAHAEDMRQRWADDAQVLLLEDPATSEPDPVPDPGEWDVAVDVALDLDPRRGCPFAERCEQAPQSCPCTEARPVRDVDELLARGAL